MGAGVVLGACTDGRLWAWDLLTAAPLATLAEHTSSINYMQLSALTEGVLARLWGDRPCLYIACMYGSAIVHVFMDDSAGASRLTGRCWSW